jgi:ATP-dependent DNA helicase RecG
MADPSHKTPAERLATAVQYLKGVGPERAALLNRLGVRYASDLLFLFPRDYQDLSEIRTIDRLTEGCLASIDGVIEEIDLRNTGPGRSLLGVLVRQDRDYLRAVWFNAPYMRKRFQTGQRVMLSGTVRDGGRRWEMAHPQVETLAPDDEVPPGKILPVYPLTEGISQGLMRRIVAGAVQTCADAVEEVFPADYLAQQKLWTIGQALREIHQPSDRQAVDKSRERFIYQELLVLQLALAIRRQRRRTRARAPALPTTAKIDARIRRLIPFELTEAQNLAIEEIRGDMAAEVPMNRLLQGEVGSGKTVVAVYAILLAVAHGRQAAMMAPTEVLARQHVLTLDNYLRHGRVRIELLVGSLSPAERRRRLEAIAAGEVDVVVGTQAVVQDDVQFARLGLVVVDEQHRFGVEQRAQLREAGLAPHYLVMTATPIPRTLAMTLFGDLDVSTIRESPPGRQAVRTYLGSDERRERWWDFFRTKLRAGRQGYVITPLVDESDQIEVRSVETAFEALANGELEEFRLDLVHGRMGGEAKAEVMDRFRSGEIQVLVATSVVEVGVDVPNATLMTIEGGERFGLAQLHQLRGRVSRGRHSGYVCVFADPQTDEAKRRLEAFVETTDGFRLADIDFQLRGPGDLLGTRQHGLPPMRIADLRRDGEMLARARSDARKLVADDPELSDTRWERLKRQVLRRYGNALDLGDVG